MLCAQLASVRKGVPGQARDQPEWRALVGTADNVSQHAVDLVLTKKTRKERFQQMLADTLDRTDVPGIVWEKSLPGRTLKTL